MNEPDKKVVFELVERIRPILADHHPAEQGAALADLLAIWLAGHSPEVRDQLFQAHGMMVLELLPANVEPNGEFKR